MDHGLEKTFTDAILNERHDVVNGILKKRSRHMGRLLYITMSCRTNAILKTILESERPCFNVNSLLKGKTLAHIAVDTNNPEGIEYLWQFGADFNIADREGYTPLYYACCGSKREVVRTLLRLGADINACQMPVQLLPQWHPVYFRFIEHIAALHGAALYVHDSYLAFLLSRTSEKNIELRCAEEVSIMKSTMVADTRIPFFRLLQCSANQLARYALNRQTREYLESLKYDERLPLYGDLLWYRIDYGLKRRDLIDESFRSLSLLDPLSRLPWGCIEYIVSFLTNEELAILNGHYRMREEI